MSEFKCKVSAFWDQEAQVWTAESENVPGLATEAETLDALTQKLRILVPELLELNDMMPNAPVSQIAIEITSHRQEVIPVTK